MSKLAIIGVVALVVIGPERLPRVARAAGLLLGRAQRYINDVKSEVAREMDMADLKAAKTEFEDAARNMHGSVNTHMRETEDSLRGIGSSVRETESSLNDTWRSLSPEPGPGTAATIHQPENIVDGAAVNPSGYSVYDETDTGAHVPFGGSSLPAAEHASNLAASDAARHDGADGLRYGASLPVRRRNWRIKQTTPPVWYKRAQGVRSQLQSGAARVARHRAVDSDRPPTRFL
ncbi:twin-arginine translocase TatA/TatE family subunit [Robbsia sp. KACC 23696]|uniref:twin-arginine translocase TatA/TatE family subunit n=1 Tax=Robbsia sp. KACC 23696 TaxID=3149231 RepID=UPI00325A70DB